MLYGIAGAAVSLLALIALVYKIEGQGRKAEQNEQMKGVLDDIEATAAARDRLRHDPDDVKRVRERFTRRLL